MKKLTFCAMLFLGLTVIGFSGAKANVQYQFCMNVCNNNYLVDRNVGGLDQCWRGCEKHKNGYGYPPVIF